MQKVRPVFALTCVAALAACSVSENKTDEEGAEAPADMTPEGPSVLAELFGGGEPMPLNIQQAHPNGLVLQLTAIQAKPSETVIKAIVTNGDDDEQALNRYNNNKNTYIVTEEGSKLFVSPPAANRDLNVPAGQRMEAELVFLGRLPKSGTATLIINETGQTDSEYTNSPAFRIPLPLQDAAFSDDGSKKN